jgi:hypothetical protein
MAISKADQLAQAGQYPSKELNKREQKVLQVAESFSPAVPGDWETAPTTQDEALDALAAAGSSIMAVSTVEWDFSVDGGAVGNINLGVTIPDNALLVEVVRDVLTAPTSGTSTGTIQLNVPTDGAVDASLTADGAAASAATFDTTPLKLSAARELRVTIGTEAITAGKIKWFVRYMKSI